MIADRLYLWLRVQPTGVAFKSTYLSKYEIEQIWPKLFSENKTLSIKIICNWLP